MRHCATRRQSYHPERYVYRRFNRLSFFYRFVLTTFRRENIRADKRLRFPVFFFFSISVSLSCCLSPHSHQSTTVVTVPTEAKANLRPISLRAPSDPFPQRKRKHGRVYIYIYIRKLFEWVYHVPK